MPTNAGKYNYLYDGMPDSVEEICNIVHNIFIHHLDVHKYNVDAMVIIPCSMNSLARIACGIGDTLMLRAADVCLKERRQLILVPREMPYNIIHLENMLKLSKAGATIVPASPGFYNKPLEIQQLVDHVNGKILDLLGINHNLYERWDDCISEYRFTSTY